VMHGYAARTRIGGGSNSAKTRLQTSLIEFGADPPSGTIRNLPGRCGRIAAVGSRLGRGSLDYRLFDRWIPRFARAHPRNRSNPGQMRKSRLCIRRNGFSEMVPGAGIEPARLAAGDFESPASTNFTTRANSI
jgi:hypothetical protein